MGVSTVRIGADEYVALPRPLPSSSALEAALNLPRVTLSAAYEASLLYGDASSSVGTP